VALFITPQQEVLFFESVDKIWQKERKLMSSINVRLLFAQYRAVFTFESENKTVKCDSFNEHSQHSYGFLYFAVMLVLTFESVNKIFCQTTSMKAIERYFPEGTLYYENNMVLTFESVDDFPSVNIQMKASSCCYCSFFTFS